VHKVTRPNEDVARPEHKVTRPDQKVAHAAMVTRHWLPWQGDHP
jgi:hypothetical protein